MVNFRTLDLNLLRVFVALDETQNVTRAAQQLGLSQPAVSAALARLRDHLDDPLFVRVGNGMAPTPRAAAAAPAIADALVRLETALAATETFVPETAEATFSLRGADFFSMRLIPSFAAALAQEAPGITIRFLDSGRGDLIDLLQTGEIDMALEQPTEVPPWVASALLFPSPFKIVAAPDNPAIREAGVRSGDVLPLKIFCGLPHALRSIDGTTTGMTDAALARQGLRRRVALVVPHFDAVVQAVARSNMIASVPVQMIAEAAWPRELMVFEPPIDIPAPRMQLYWHSRFNRAAAHVWFRTRLLAEVHRLWGGEEAPA
ncbi:LysR family transcriptional regulator [Defluviimonas sp. WL0075]|uniref:LysR family transcriptional regulator n=1 Tax=Albidovulum sediminicola TaxID=2984331 RepID=A0ABT2YWX7_9RHOB|nr:LysR family transcriptional regulator [Defluviimonas sp. WL0075]MCV2863372.1 LysR family transcriptional regulator [Defluviimonas sp. WL0075]